MTSFQPDYHFQDVAIKPQQNICKSRLDVDIKYMPIRGISLDVPIISSNMSTVTNADFALKINALGGLGVLHRAWPNNEDYLKEVKKLAENDKRGLIAASIGITDDQFDLTIDLVHYGCNIIVMDVANVFTEQAIKLGRMIKSDYKDNVKLVYGNTTCPEFLKRVADHADSVKIGIGSNSTVCETYENTGVTRGQFSAIYDLKDLSARLGLPIISDGGIRRSGDFCKAIGGGAAACMLGTVLARCPESAAPEIEVDGKCKKAYAGMSSRTIQNNWRGMKEGICPEGKVTYLDIGESVGRLFERYSGALRSSITYSNADDINSFQKNVEFVRFK